MSMESFDKNMEPRGSLSRKVSLFARKIEDMGLADAYGTVYDGNSEREIRERDEMVKTLATTGRNSKIRGLATEILELRKKISQWKKLKKKMKKCINA